MSTAVPTIRELDATNARIDEAGRQFNKVLSKLNTLDGKVKTLESRASRHEGSGFSDFHQEYEVRPAGAPLVTALAVTDFEMKVAATTFVRSIGKLNRYYLKHALKDTGGDAARALSNALALYPTAR